MTDPAEDHIRRRRLGDRNRILEIAAERLAEHGYNATSLADIAILGGVEASVVSFHFPTKEDLVEAVLRAGIDHALDAIDRALADGAGSGADRLGRAMEAYLEAVSANQHMTRANIRCYRSVSPVLRRGLAVHTRGFVDRWISLIAAGQQDGSLRDDVDASVVARMVIAALNSAVTWMHAEDIGDVARQFRATLLDGLSVR